VLLVAGLVCIATGAVLWWQHPLGDTQGSSTRPGDHSSSKPSAATPGRDADLAGCGSPTRPFAPVRVTIPGVARNVAVVPAVRDGKGVPGVPPLTDTGKHELAWDAPGIEPGAPRGHVLMNAHTGPDGSALGNALLRGLHVGDVVAVHGDAGQRLCYRVVDRLVTPFPDTPQHVLARYYSTTGRPQLAVTVCSGRRLGPGRWTQRTLWFARPLSVGTAAAPEGP
jgi:hypothetical protein